MDSPEHCFKMETVLLQKAVNLPDAISMARYARAPELGPRILFFSGGSALNGLSKAIVRYTHNSTHVITTFDSGGSSKKLREAFDMPAVGDLRSRLMALADQTVTGAPEIYKLFAFRFPADEDSSRLHYHLKKMIDGKDPLVSAITDPMRKIIRTHLKFFAENAPGDFDLRGASIGNLILVGGYLNNRRHLDPVIFLFSKLVEARGVVRPVVNEPLHLAAELANGSVVTGQSLITGKEAPPLNSRIKKLRLVKRAGKRGWTEARAPIREKMSGLISEADLICYPMGSFFTSVIANLLPEGIGKAISGNLCPKIYIPNTAADPEMTGMTLYDCVREILNAVRKSSGGKPPVEKILNFILVDANSGTYQAPMELEKIKKAGVRVISTPLVTEKSYPYLDEDRLLGIMLSLA